MFFHNLVRPQKHARDRPRSTGISYTVAMSGYRVFISHGGDDTFVVKELLRPKVESSGATVFVDAGTIDYGDDFRDLIFRELSLCDELLVLLTHSSLRRPWVLAEVGAVLVRSKRVVAVRYGPTELDLQETGFLSLLGTRSLLRLDDFDEYLKQLHRRVAEVKHA